jgi:hypothetical protein
MRRTLWLLAIGAAVALLVLALLLIVDAHESDRTRDARRATEVATCRESNVPNAYIRLVLARSPGFDPSRLGLPAPERVLPILSCAQGAEAGHPVRLRPSQERRYLVVFAHGHLPIVRAGQVVGAEPFPAPPRPRR